MPSLEALGWGESFARAFEPLAEPDVVPGRVALEHKHIYRVLTEQGELLAKASGRLRHEATGPVEYPAVGDWVAIRLKGHGRAVVLNVLPRRSKFSRKVAGDLTLEQVVAANIDFVFLATGLDANFNLRRIERYLVTAWESGAQPVVLLTKADLAEDLEARIREVETVATGAPVVVTSAKAGTGLDALTPFLLPGRTVAILGSSGVGKSTLINRIVGRDIQRTAELSADGIRGRHTTTARELIVLPSGALVIDTPGLREIQLWDAAGSLGAAFADIEEIGRACHFSDCNHDTEPRCAVRLAVAEGRLEVERLENYIKLQREALHMAEKQDQFAQLERKRKWKVISKAVKSFTKGR
jgi:ribosome biogenesis GTPase